ncbi:MAG: lamin tail domain-containing protein [Patescibacteria group bacterium]
MQKKNPTTHLLAILTLASLLANPFMVLAQTATLPSIIITEIAAAEPSDTEWIEIHNNSRAPVDMTGYKFFEEKTNHGLSVFRGDFILDAEEYAIIANKADLVAQKYPAYAGTILDSSWVSLKQDGEEIGLKDAAGNLAEVFTYPAWTGSVSLERKKLEEEANLASNWAMSESSHSLGQKRQEALPAAAISLLEEEDVGTSTAAVEQEIDAQDANSLALVAVAPPPPPAPSFSPVPSFAFTHNTAPQPIITVQSGALTAYGQTTVNFSGTMSYDPNGDALTFLWDMGDGTRSQSANPAAHKYAKPGNYTVTLTITDTFGTSGIAKEKIQVFEKTEAAATKETGAKAETQKSETKTEPKIEKTVLQSSSKSEAASNSSAKTELSFIPPLQLNPQTLQLQGYFVFIPYGDTPKIKMPKQAAIKKIKTPKASGVKKESAKSPQISNGDLSADIKISEIFPNPAENQEEWIELMNGGTESVNLGNWGLSDGGKTSPFRIPDSIVLEPGMYAAFPKSLTHIALNNDRDEVILTDFQGNIMDRINYDTPKKGSSYALISSAWEWTDTPTPGSQNPVFEKMEGTVGELIQSADADSSAFQIMLSDGSSKNIQFAKETLDPLMADILMAPGTRMSVQAAAQSDGNYLLKKIEDVSPAAANSEKNIGSWWMIAAAGASLLGGAIFFLARKFLRKSQENSSGEKKVAPTSRRGIYPVASPRLGQKDNFSYRAPPDENWL